MGPCHPTLSLLCPPLEGKTIEQPFLLVFKQALKVGFPYTNSLNFKLNRYRNPGIQSKKKAHINKYYNQASHFLRKQIYNQFPNNCTNMASATGKYILKSMVVHIKTYFKISTQAVNTLLPTVQKFKFSPEKPKNKSHQQLTELGCKQKTIYELFITALIANIIVHVKSFLMDLM